MDAELLKEGDVLYSYHRYGKGLNKHIVKKVTNTQAILDNGTTKVRREINTSNYGKYCREIGGYAYYHIEDEALKNKYEWWVANRKVHNLWRVFDIDKLSTDELNTLEHLLTNLINKK